jgi:hypothetical protein
MRGDTLVIDTVGVKIGRVTMVDRYGTPQSDAIHVVERYRTIDVAAAKEAMTFHERRVGRGPGAPGTRPPDPNFGKALQLPPIRSRPEHLHDALVGPDHLPAHHIPESEQVCAGEHRRILAGHEYRHSKADRPDF